MASERIANMSSFSGSKLRLLLKISRYCSGATTSPSNSRPLLSMVSPLLLADQVSVLSWFDWVSSPAVSRPVDRGGLRSFCWNTDGTRLYHIRRDPRFTAKRRKAAKSDTLGDSGKGIGWSVEKRPLVLKVPGPGV